MSKLVKNLEYAALTKTFAGVRDLLLITPTKVDSAMDASFRKTLREKKIRVQMVKNTLARKIFEAQGVKVEGWSGTTLVAWGAESIKDLSKTVDGLIKEIIKKNPKHADKLVIKTAVADGVTVPMEMALKMPTRLEAIGEVVGMILGPGASLASALTSAGSQVASQIASIADKKEEAETPAA